MYPIDFTTGCMCMTQLYSGHREKQSVAEIEKYELVVINSRQGIVILKPCVVRIVVRQVVVLKYEGEASG